MSSSFTQTSSHSSSPSRLHHSVVSVLVLEEAERVVETVRLAEGVSVGVIEIDAESEGEMSEVEAVAVGSAEDESDIVALG